MIECHCRYASLGGSTARSTVAKATLNVGTNSLFRFSSALPSLLIPTEYNRSLHFSVSPVLLLYHHCACDVDQQVHTLMPVKQGKMSLKTIWSELIYTVDILTYLFMYELG